MTARRPWQDLFPPFLTHRLVEAALDQQRPGPALYVALQAYLTATQHPDRLLTADERRRCE